MVKQNRGLPPSFTIDVNRSALAGPGPANLGDYLDEEHLPKSVTPKPVPLKRPAFMQWQPSSTNVVPMPRESQIKPSLDSDEAEESGLIRRGKSIPRIQLNMNAETFRMVDELLRHIQTYSCQKDAKASELFHALVSSLYEARELIDFTNVQPRGKWGSPTAKAFPNALKSCFQDAITDWQLRNRG